VFPVGPVLPDGPVLPVGPLVPSGHSECSKLKGLRLL
jgi:hypothetical protein